MSFILPSLGEDDHLPSASGVRLPSPYSQKTLLFRASL
jgi:hypothetical protein